MNGFFKRLNEEKKEIHEMARSKGWWDNERGKGELYALFHSEISEAVEEERKPAFPDIKDRAMYHFETSYDINEGDQDGIVKKAVPGVKWDPETNTCVTKPEGTAVEVVDMVIRVLDYMGHRNIDLVEGVEEKEESWIDFDHKGLDAFAVMHGLLSSAFLNFALANTKEESKRAAEEEHFLLTTTMVIVKKYFQKNELEFWKVYEAKKSFNSTREKRHGGKKY